MDEAVGLRIALGKRLVEGLDRQARLKMVGERPADRFAREGVEDDRQIDEVLRQPDIGDVGDPYLVEAGRSKPAGQIRHDGKAVAAVGGAGDERSGAQAEQVVGAHQPEHPFGVDDQSLASQLLGDAPIAVMAVGERDALDQIAQIRLLARRQAGTPTAIVAGARHVGQTAQPAHVGVVFEKALRLGGDHLFDDRVEAGAPPLRLVASHSRKASRKKCRSAC